MGASDTALRLIVANPDNFREARLWTVRTRWSSFLTTHPSGRCFDGAAHGHEMYFERGRSVRNRSQRDRYLHVLPGMRKAAQFVAM